MKRILSIVLVGAAVTTAALAFAGNQTPSAKEGCCCEAKASCSPAATANCAEK